MAYSLNNRYEMPIFCDEDRSCDVMAISGRHQCALEPIQIKQALRSLRYSLPAVSWR